jgi:4-aminobutyrate aminotransferase-like enzyme
MILGVELVKDHKAKMPATFELGLLLTYVGTYSNVVEITPPLTIGIEEVDRALEILEKALDDVEKDRVDRESVRRFVGW